MLVSYQTHTQKDDFECEALKVVFLFFLILTKVSVYMYVAIKE